MGQHSAIEWTDHTFNPWWGCTKVSPGCKRCYAENWARRYGHDIWGAKKNRRFFSSAHWKQPIKWNNQALASGRRARVFCASMADVFEENQMLNPERKKLWDLIEQTPMLDWLLLTKRPENMLRLTPWRGQWPKNVWAMATMESQDIVEERMPHLLAVQAIVRGLSIEPMLGPVDLSHWINDIDWVIAGGESGVGSRPMNPEWVRALRDQCLRADVPFFFKQWGNWVPIDSKDSAKEFLLKTREGELRPLAMKRLSKKAAGNKLDGLVWSQLPNSV